MVNSKRSIPDTSHYSNKTVEIKLNNPTVESQRQNLESSKREATFHYSRLSVRLIPDFSSEAMEVARWWDNIFRALNRKDCQLRILCPAK